MNVYLTSRDPGKENGCSKGVKTVDLDDDADPDGEFTLIQLDLRRLSQQALREIAQQVCLAFGKHYRPPIRVYWPLPCGHGF